MSPDYWQKIKLILDEALERTPAARAAYLAERCGANQTLRRDVESLLAFENTDGDALEASALAAVEDLKISEDNFVGKTFGSYKILEKIGEGGMGAVFLAERDDGEFRQTVAVKLIRSGIASAAVVRRFLNERQILAELEHPNIARLIDGGTSKDDVPFLVMEYVEGAPIDDYADQKDSSLTERLELFRRVCAAVAHAHKNLVIHRDLKPSNILVGEDGEPKLLDFGIAKLLKDGAGETLETRQLAFTPDYASPEQVRGEKLTTATDVYSLGVILYELLTGARPYQTDSGNLGEVIRVVCETEPERPSEAVVSRQLSVTSQEISSDNATDENKVHTNENQPRTNPKSKIGNPKSLKGDLDNIILKALRKEPSRRYSSVEQFSEDIRRHLVGLPVAASADTWTYRASKFIQRNRVGASAAGLILLALLGGLGATLYQANIARRERAKAEQNYNDVRQLANSFLFEFHDEISDLPGATPARELVVKRALEYLNKLTAAGDGGDAGLQRELATAYERVGKIQGNSYYSNLGDTPGAAASYQKSLEIRQRLHRADPTNREIRLELAASYEGVGDMFYTDNDLPNGLRNYEQALALRLPLAEAEPNDWKNLRALSELHARLGDIKGMEGYANLGDTLGAVEEYERAVAVSEKLAVVEPDDDSQSALALRLQNLAMLQSTVGKSAEALQSGRKVRAAYETLVARDPDNAVLQRNFMSSLIALRYPLVDEGLLAEAETNARLVIAEMEKAVAADPKNVSAARSLSVSYNALGRVLLDGGKARAAIPQHERALKMIEEIAAATPSGEFKTDVTLTRSFLAEAQLAANDHGAALVNFQRCAADYEKDLEDSANARTKDNLATVYAGAGSALAATNRNFRAAEFFERAIPLAEEAARKSPHNVRVQSRLAKIYFESGKNWKSYARLTDDEKSLKQACGFLQKSFDVWDNLRQKQTLSKINAARPNEAAKELTGCQTL